VLYVQVVSGLSQGQVLRVVNDYVGVHGGYLGDFTYRTHSEFYPLYCDIDHVDAYNVPRHDPGKLHCDPLGPEPSRSGEDLEGLVRALPDRCRGGTGAPRSHSSVDGGLDQRA
jgi:hypothetical protein